MDSTWAHDNTECPGGKCGERAEAPAIEPLPISIVIPTYQRNDVLVDTLRSIHRLEEPPLEILVMDQTLDHDAETLAELSSMEQAGTIRWLHLKQPSIPMAMNRGLELASSDLVLFLDDDVRPHTNLLRAHVRAHRDRQHALVVGRVIQPGGRPMQAGPRRSARGWAPDSSETIDVNAGNLSVRRSAAMSVRGFDENFVQVAYRFESEFADRLLAAGYALAYEPDAIVDHLRAESGGTRHYGNHLRTLRAGHAVGAYYYLLSSPRLEHRALWVALRVLRSVRTLHHLRHPWWIPGTVFAELLGLLWALQLYRRGPQLIRSSDRREEL